ncbi:MAG: polysaccharide deacetylase family protein [Candidatus Binatia bacterium]
MYHGLWSDPNQLLGRSPAEVRYWIEAKVFEEQLCRLAALGYTAVTLADLPAYRTDAVAAKPIVLTFDDGWVSDWQIATPILKRLGWKAEFFVTVGWVGKPGFLAWDDLRQALSAGMEIQSHSMTHPDLTQLSREEIRTELLTSKETLEERLGKSIAFFALPGGSGRLSEVAQLARETGYVGVCTSEVRLNPLARLPFCLHRIPVVNTTTSSELEAWVQGRGLKALSWRRKTLRFVRRLCGAKLYEWTKAKLLQTPLTS